MPKIKNKTVPGALSDAGAQPCQHDTYSTCISVKKKKQLKTQSEFKNHSLPLLTLTVGSFLFKVDNFHKKQEMLL